MTIVKLPLPEEKLDRLLEVAKREGRQEDVAKLNLKLCYQQMMEAALSFLNDED